MSFNQRFMERYIMVGRYEEGPILESPSSINIYQFDTISNCRADRVTYVCDLLYGFGNPMAPQIVRKEDWEDFLKAKKAMGYRYV